MTETELQKHLRETGAKWTATDKPVQRSMGLNMEHKAMMHELDEEDEDYNTRI